MKALIVMLIVNSFAMGAWADNTSSLPELECKTSTGAVAFKISGKNRRAVMMRGGSEFDVFGCKDSPLNPSSTEIVWCQQTRFDTNYRVRVLTPRPEDKDTYLVRLTQNGFLGKTVEKGYLRCFQVK
jgi:hypothetical protein